MPELSDVEGFKRYFTRYAAGHRIEGVEVRDEEILRNTSAQGLGRAVSGEQFDEPQRRGKWLLAPAGNSVVVMHFGMTGGLDWSGEADRHEHDRVVFRLDSGELRYRAQRKLGGVWLAGDEREIEEITGPLGPDADEVTREDLTTLLKQRRGGIKSALMDQELIAGIGNELSDEILWRARINPGTQVSDLDEGDLDDLHEAMEGVLRDSIKHGVIPSEGEWLNSQRRADDPTCPRCGAKLEKETVAGRSSFWCPKEQPR